MYIDKNILDLDGLKFELKSVYVADFAQQASTIKEVAEIVQEVELKQAFAEVTELVHLIQTISATSASCEISFSSLNDYMRCCQSEEQLSNMFLISMNKDFLKKMKLEHVAETFYNMINEFDK